MDTTKIIICLGSSCFSRGNETVLALIKKYLKDHYLTDRVDFRGELCSCQCTHGPNIKVNGEIIHDIHEDNIESILNQIFASAV
ncbi:MAG: hypothetical protein RIS47_791 [Bacteroidota bacterium]|jgi:NADH:ubiquinone oxidoreductase subunit E